MVTSMNGTAVNQSFPRVTGVTSNSSLSYGGEVSISSFSMSSSIAGHLSDINASGWVPAVNAAAIHDQGVVHVGPAP
jgi:hypothetical protein